MSYSKEEKKAYSVGFLYFSPESVIGRLSYSALVALNPYEPGDIGHTPFMIGFRDAEAVFYKTISKDFFKELDLLKEKYKVEFFSGPYGDEFGYVFDKKFYVTKDDEVFLA